MPVTLKHRIERSFGQDCVFAICNFKNFLGALPENYSSVDGISETETPYGTGVKNIGNAGTSRVDFNLVSLAPLATTPRSMFSCFYLSSLTPSAGTKSPIFMYGPNNLRDSFWLYVSNTGAYGGGGFSDYDEGGVCPAQTWVTACVTNTGVNGGANIIYAQGSQVAAGTNGGNLITSYLTPRMFRDNGGTAQCALNSIVQSLLIFSRVLTPAEVLDLHNACIANKL